MPAGDSRRGPRATPTRFAIPSRRLSATACGMVAIVAAIPVPVVAQSDRPALRREYFYRQRAYPHPTIPAGAFEAGRADAVARFGFAAGASAPGLASQPWESIGPDGIDPGFPFPFTASGRVSALAMHSSDPNVIYAGGAQGGVWRSTDGGGSWTALTDGECSLAMGSVAIDPADPNTLFVGTGEQHFSGDSYYGCGVLRSTNGGASWAQVGGSAFTNPGGPGAQIARVVIDPEGAGTLGTTRLIVASNFGLHRSTNGGTSFTNVAPVGALWTDVVIDPTDDDTWYAAGFTNARTLASGSGVWKSTADGAGGTWTLLGGGFPASSIFRINLSLVATATGTTLYAAVVDNNDTGELLGIYRSDDGGMTWTQTATTPECGQCAYDLVIAADPTDANTVYFGGVDFFRSTDGGGSFSPISTFPNGRLHADQHLMLFDPTDPTRALIGNDGGVFESVDGGTIWNDLNTDLSLAQFYAGVSLHPTDANTVLGGTQDNGTVLTTGARLWDAVLGGDGGYTAFDRDNPSTMYVESQWSGDPNDPFPGPQRSDNGGATFLRKVNGIDLSDGAQFIPPLVMDPANSQTLYFGTFRLYRTTDRGESWTAISGDLTKAGVSGPIAFEAVSAIAIAPTDGDVIYVGTGDGNVHVTQDGGTTFTPIVTGLPNRFVTDIAVHPTDPQTAYLTVSGFGSGHVFKTTNAGVVWLDVSTGLPNLPANAVLVEPGTPETVYVGTDLSVYASQDGGASWSAFGAGLPMVAVFDLAANATTGVLVAATHGRGMWRSTFGANAPLALNVDPIMRTDSSIAGLTETIDDSAAVDLAGTGAPAAQWTASHTAAPWLTLTTASGTGSGTVAWTVDPAGVQGGTLVDTITVTATGATGSPSRIEVTLVVAEAIALTTAVDHVLTGTGLSALEVALLDARGNADGTFNVGDVLAWLDLCRGATPAGCIATAPDIERARALLRGGDSAGPAAGGGGTSR